MTEHLLTFYIWGRNDHGDVIGLGMRLTEKKAQDRVAYWKSAGWSEVWIETRREKVLGLR